MTAVTAGRLRSVVCAEMSYSGEMKAMFPGGPVAAVHCTGMRFTAVIYWVQIALLTVMYLYQWWQLPLMFRRRRVGYLA